MFLFKKFVKSFRFRDLASEIKARLALDHAEIIYDLSNDPYCWNYRIRDAFTTALLRTNCGCESEPYFDELLGEWKIMEGHDRGCLFRRYPISEDLSDATIKRRGKRERPHDNEGLLHIEEKSYATTK